MSELTVGSLFAGIGGFDLGFERAGMRTLWACEQAPFCQVVLRERFPNAIIYPDVRELHAGAPGLVVPDVLCGGFPCQDISTAGYGKGIHGERSALWFEFHRLIGELRPRYVVVENVDKLRSRGLDVVISGLASLGYDAEWDVIRASDLGAPHRRARMWIVAYPQRDPVREQSGRRGWPNGEGPALAGLDGARGRLADADGRGRGEGQRGLHAGEPHAPGCGEELADANGERLEVACRIFGHVRAQLEALKRSREGGRDEDLAYAASLRRELSGAPWPWGDGSQDAGGGRGGDVGAPPVADADSAPRGSEGAAGEEVSGSEAVERSRRCGGRASWPWAVEPDVGRVAHGVPARVDRLRGLGNALVPQIAEVIGRAIVHDAQG